jgi:hypothetical protein
LVASKRPRQNQRKPPAGSGSSNTTSLSVRKRTEENVWELVHPRCACDRQDDLEEVRKIMETGELDVARDECRWLLEGCSDCLEAHRILGEIALADHDLPLARGHFAQAYRQGAKAIERARLTAALPYRLPANRSFFESAKGLVWCLRQLDRHEMAAEIVTRVVALDPEDPLHIQGVMTDSPGC